MLVRCLIALASCALPGVASAEPQVDWDQEISLSLRGADLLEVLSSFATIGGGVFAAAPEVEGKVTIELDEVPFARSLGHICSEQGLACYWIDGATPTLEVKKPDVGFVGFAESIQLSLRDAGLVEVLESLSIITNGAVELGDELEGSISIELNNAPWPVALEEICRLAGCRVDWSTSPARVGPGSAAEAFEPAAGEAVGASTLVVTPLAAARSASIDLQVRLGAEVDEPSAVRFTWARPVARLPVTSARRLHLAWIPFDRQIVLPLLVDCTRDTASLLEPVALPLEGPVRRALDGVELELAPLPAGSERSMPNPSASMPCAEGDPVAVRLQESGVAHASPARTALGRHVGDYVLITPPAGGARPAAAVVRLGTVDGSPRVALVEPSSEAPAAVEMRTLDRLPYAAAIDHAGRTFSLEIHAGASVPVG